MVDVCPLNGWRYDLAQVGDLSDVTCPPYDVIDPALQTQLYKQHPCNAVRLELNRAEPGDSSSAETYRRAAGFWKHWRIDGVLQQDPEDTLYVYHQTFQWEGIEYTRQGFIGRLRLEPLGSGKVFPHEETLAGPKADRLALFEACRANLSPIFALYSDDQQEIQQKLEDACVTLTPLQATDPQGVIHRLWPLNDRAIISQVRTALRDHSVFIADGHHRYETALNYQQELAAAGKLTDTSDANFVLAHFVGMQDPGLKILPTHRLVSGIPMITSQELRHALEGEFHLEFMGVGAQGAIDTWDMVSADGTQSALGFGCAADGGWWYARLIDSTKMDSLAADHSDDWRGLAVSRLHRLVMEHLLPGRFPEFAPKYQYVHRVDEVTAALKKGDAQLGCLLPPAEIEHLELIAEHQETMPPKSTYFYPKLLTGMVFHSLD